MKVMKALKAAFALTALVPIVAACDDGGGGGTAVGFPGGPLCKVHDTCSGATAVAGTVFVVPARCDLSVRDASGNGRCVVQLAPGSQCSEDQIRAVSMANGQPGIVKCNKLLAPLDWGPQVQCGGRNRDGSMQDCCVGGCKTGFKCADVLGAIDTKCVAVP